MDWSPFDRLVTRAARFSDSVCVLGSTGSYLFLSREERREAVIHAVAASLDAPIVAGIGALATRHVLEHAEDAQRAGAAALLLAPASYQALRPDEVFHLYDEVSRAVDVPLIVYDNPSTTRFTFSDELLVAIAGLPRVAAIKVPPISTEPGVAEARLGDLRASLPGHVLLGISGDASASNALAAGFDTWFSVLGGTLPALAREMTQAALAGDLTWDARLAPVWRLFAAHGSLRTVAAIAEALGLTGPSCLPRPLHGLEAAARRDLGAVLQQLGLGEESSRA